MIEENALNSQLDLIHLVSSNFVSLPDNSSELKWEVKFGDLFAKDKKQGIYICDSSMPQILPEIPMTNRKQPFAVVL